MLRRIATSLIGRAFESPSILTAESGRLGVESTGANKPDVILLDSRLPDMEVDEICQRLEADPQTAEIPVVLMYASGGNDLLGLQQRHPNIRYALPKPFTPELLIETLRSLVDPEGRTSLAQPSAPRGPHFILPAPVGGAAPADGTRARVNLAAPEMLFSGHTGLIPVRTVLRTLETDGETGLLRVFTDRMPVELYFSGGCIVLATTRDLTLYCLDSPAQIPDLTPELLDEVKLNQSTTGHPLFLTLLDRGLISRGEAVEMARDHGQRLFSRTWPRRRTSFEFERSPVLPEFIHNFPPATERVDQWMLKTLRYLKPAALANASVPLDAIPRFRPGANDRMAALKLVQSEARFLAAVNGVSTIGRIARDLELPIEEAKLLLFRGISLDLLQCPGFKL